MKRFLSSIVVVVDHALTIEEQLHWSDYFDVIDCL